MYFSHKMQPLAPSESESGVKASSSLGGGEDGVGVGVRRRKEQAGVTISEGNGSAPSLLFSQSASRCCTLGACRRPSDRGVPS